MAACLAVLSSGCHCDEYASSFGRDFEKHIFSGFRFVCMDMILKPLRNDLKLHPKLDLPMHTAIIIVMSRST